MSAFVLANKGERLELQLLLLKGGLFNILPSCAVLYVTTDGLTSMMVSQSFNSRYYIYDNFIWLDQTWINQL